MRTQAEVESRDLAEPPPKAYVDPKLRYNHQS